MRKATITIDDGEQKVIIIFTQENENNDNVKTEAYFEPPLNVDGKKPCIAYSLFDGVCKGLGITE